jgi:hypothetical protein
MQDNRLALKCGGIEPKRRAGELVSKRQPFSNSGETFRGVVGHPGTLGELPHPPIAWLTEDGWTMPDVTYSPTTTQHQGVVRVYCLTGEEVAA